MTAEPTLLEKFHSFICQNPGCTPRHLFFALDRYWHKAANYQLLKTLESRGLIRKQRLGNYQWGPMVLYSNFPQMEDMPNIHLYDS